VPTPFHDLAEYLAVPRVTGLRLSPDGTWLAASVATLSADRKKMLSSIWRIDTAGGSARRLTRSSDGEGNPRFLPDGSLLYSIEAADGSHRYYSFDEAGSTTMLTGDDGSIVDAYRRSRQPGTGSSPSCQCWTRPAR